MKRDVKNAPHISMTQLVVLLLVSRAVALLTRSAALSVAARARETILGLALSVAVVLLFECRPVAALLRKIVPGTIAKLFLLGYLLVSAVRALLSFTVFIQTESEDIFPGLLITLMLTVIVFCALRTGIEGIARFAFIVGLIFAALLGFMVIANGTRMEITNLGLADDTSGRAIPGIALANILLCPEIPAYFVLKRFVCEKDAGRRGFRTFFVVQSVGCAAFATAQELVFGSLAQIQHYPIYSLAVVGEFSIFQRLDIMHLSMWCLITVVELSALSITGETLVAVLLPRAKHAHIAAAICAALAAGALLMMSVFASGPAVIEWVMAGLLATTVIFSLPSALGRNGKLKVEK